MRDDVTLGAIGSSEARYALLVESIETTINHPLLGVGIGVYSSVNAREKQSVGEHALWQVTHNMFTQLSAETGVPGFLLYMTALYLSIKAVWNVRKAARGRPELRELGMIASAILGSFIVFLFNGLFTSMAFEFTAYILAGLALATAIVYQDVLRRMEASSPAAATSAVPPAGSSRFFPASVPVTQPVVVAPAVPAPLDQNSDAPWRRNPRKFPPKPGAPSR